jgi:hypothetical protein
VKLKAMFGAVTAALVAVPSALAVGSAQSVYGGTAGVSQAQVQSAHKVVHQVVHQAPTVSSSGSLPFTGLDLILLAGGGLILILIGITLYLVSRQRVSA